MISFALWAAALVLIFSFARPIGRLNVAVLQVLRLPNAIGRIAYSQLVWTRFLRTMTVLLGGSLVVTRLSH